MMFTFTPQVSIRPMGHGTVEVRVGHDLLDDYLRFVAARCRTATADTSRGVMSTGLILP